MRVAQTLILLILTLFVTIKITVAEEVTAKKKVTAQQPLIIESKVTGSQEQPKVLYIMPWQGITNPITIEDKEMQLTLPSFQPINPKIFKQEVRDFAENQAKAKSNP